MSKRKFINNDDLFDSPKDAKIARLKCKIEQFKEYDKKRTEDYHKVYKALEWYKEELAQKNELIKSLQDRIKELEEE